MLFAFPRSYTFNFSGNNIRIGVSSQYFFESDLHWKPSASHSPLNKELNSEVMMVETKQHGGRREGAGRPVGSRNKRSLDAIELVAKSFPNWHPLLHMATVANDTSLSVEVRLDAAKSAAPFMLAKAKPVVLDHADLIELEREIAHVRLGTAADLARDDPHLLNLAERLARAAQRNE